MKKGEGSVRRQQLEDVTVRNIRSRDSFIQKETGKFTPIRSRNRLREDLNNFDFAPKFPSTCRQISSTSLIDQIGAHKSKPTQQTCESVISSGQKVRKWYDPNMLELTEEKLEVKRIVDRLKLFGLGKNFGTAEITDFILREYGAKIGPKRAIEAMLILFRMQVPQDPAEAPKDYIALANWILDPDR